MEFANDLMNSLRARVQPAGTDADSRLLNWGALHARLSAAHAARAALGGDDSRSQIPVGSFVDWLQSDKSGANASQRVNPTDSTDSKVPQGMNGDIAEQLTDGG